MEKDKISEILDRAKNELLAVLEVERSAGRQIALVELAPEEEERVRELRRVRALEYLTREELAVYLNVSDKTVDELTKEGMPCVEMKTGAHTRPMKRFRRVAVDKWLESGAQLRKVS